ncbi:pilus assembly protein [Brevundimonas sp. 2R-24]|uniref:Pilus assembly protein n=1 Tax=Peiella sedimenti TaxID=3061083 RepID=A0ABT8SIH5_9CAUL|nr:pilus assembly protein [Caulobacteraceae bacterium XZ-24]
MSARAAFLRDQRGGGAAEFALVLPAFIALLMGLWEFGWTQHCISSVRFATQKASRAVLVNPDLSQTQVQAMVRQTLTDVADPSVTVTLATLTSGPTGRTARITSVYTREIGVPGVATWPFRHTTVVDAILPAY